MKSIGVLIYRCWIRILVLGSGLVLAAVSYTSITEHEQQTTRERFERAANDRYMVLERGISEGLMVTRALGGLFAASQQVERDEFRRFAQPLLGAYPGVKALEWVPRVASGRRAWFEQELQHEYPGAGFTEQRAGVGLVRAGERDEYYPVFFMEPYAGNEVALGYDLGSDPGRRAILDAARDSGKLLATPWINLVQEKSESPGFMLVVPFYRSGMLPAAREGRRENIKGFLVVVLRVEELVEHALASLKPGGVDLVISDTAPGRDRPLSYVHHSRTRSSATGLQDQWMIDSKQRLGSHYQLEVAGQRWSVRAAAAPGYYLMVTPPLALLASGSVLVVMTVILVYLTKLNKDRRRLSQENLTLERLSQEDALTGIANRRAFDIRLHQEWLRALRAQDPLGLILIDIDHFKDYNDHYGHQAGDLCLRKIAQACKAVCTRTPDLVCRYGGEEIAVILPDTPLSGVCELAERMHQAVGLLEIEHVKSPVSAFVSVSMGVGSVVPQDDKSDVALIYVVDNALYRAKQNGRNCMVTAAGTEEPDRSLFKVV